MGDRYVMLVEDNPDDVVLAQIAFRKCRIPNKLAVAWNGEEALDFLFSRGQYADRDPGRKPAVILLDLKIPCLNGFEVLKQIREDKKTSSIPVVVLTSSVEDSDRETSYILGADNFFVKPMDFQEFTRIIRQISSKWLDWPECSPEKA
jgi:two-component system, response regulator